MLVCVQPHSSHTYTKSNLLCSLTLCAFVCICLCAAPLQPQLRQNRISRAVSPFVLACTFLCAAPLQPQLRRDAHASHRGRATRAQRAAAKDHVSAGTRMQLQRQQLPVQLLPQGAFVLCVCVCVCVCVYVCVCVSVTGLRGLFSCSNCQSNSPGGVDTGVRVCMIVHLQFTTTGRCTPSPGVICRHHIGILVSCWTTHMTHLLMH